MRIQRPMVDEQHTKESRDGPVTQPRPPRPQIPPTPTRAGVPLSLEFVAQRALAQIESVDARKMVLEKLCAQELRVLFEALNREVLHMLTGLSLNESISADDFQTVRVQVSAIRTVIHELNHQAVLYARGEHPLQHRTQMDEENGIDKPIG